MLIECSWSSLAKCDARIPPEIDGRIFNFDRFLDQKITNFTAIESRICSQSSFSPDLTVVRPSRSTTLAKKVALSSATFNDRHRI
uniref:Uncharacterized protein n=1 Tax=Romanomermis culicivorax TaxID=13658 RepID=A0A915J7L8_ROMCU